MRNLEKKPSNVGNFLRFRTENLDSRFGGLILRFKTFVVCSAESTPPPPPPPKEAEEFIEICIHIMFLSADPNKPINQ